MTSSRAADGVGVAGIAICIAALVAAREALDLSVPGVLGALVAVGLLAGVVLHQGVERCAVALLAIGVATSSWNAVGVGPIKVAHAALAAAGLALLVIARRGDGRSVRLPAWVWVLGGTIVVVTVAAVLWPPSVAHVVDRYAGQETEGITDVTVSVATLTTATIVNSLTWLVAAVAVPAVVCLAADRRSHRVRLLADAWVLGATVSAAVALSDELDLTAISESLLPVVDIGGRQAGLTVQPNHAAVAIALAVPVVLWRLATSRRPTVLLTATASLAVLVAGLLTTGSRAGAVASLAAAVSIALVEPRIRTRLPVIVGVGLVLIVPVLVAVPSLVTSLASVTRLDGSGGADASDAIRRTIAEQGVADAAHSPIFGIGPGVVDEAHNIVLQLLASGGVVLLVGFTLAWAGFVLDGWASRHQSAGLPGALAVSGVTVLALGMVTNTLTDVFVHIPFALVAGLCAARPDDRSAGGREPDRSADHDPAPVAEEIH